MYKSTFDTGKTQSYYCTSKTFLMGGGKRACALYPWGRGQEKMATHLELASGAMPVSTPNRKEA